MDSNASRQGGVAPTIRVPVNEETVARSMAGEDVQMSYALRWLDAQQKTQTPAAAGSAPAAATKAALPVMLPVLAFALGLLLAGLAGQRRE